MAHWELCRVTYEPTQNNSAMAEVIFFKTWERDYYHDMEAALLVLTAEGWEILLYYTDHHPPLKEVVLLQRLV